MKLLLLLASATLFCFSSYSAEIVPGEYIIRYKNQNPGVRTLGKTSLEHNMKLRKSWSGMNLHHFKTKDEQDSVEQTLRELREDPEILFAEPNYYVNASDMFYSMTDALIRAPESWVQASADGPSVVTPVVAVLDSGLDVTHPLFDGTGRLWENASEIPGNGIDDDNNGYVDDINGWNFINNNHDLSDPYDPSRPLRIPHGTHVSGIVVGATEDIRNVSGPARVKIMVLKFLDSDGVGTTADAVNAIYYAVDNGAKVLNNSWGGSAYSVALHEAITYSYYQGTSFVAAAGNDGSNNDLTPVYPANYDVPNVISVGASTDNDNLASFSNFGSDTVDLVAPGVAIESILSGGGYAQSSGTSMASPFVAGLASMVSREAPQFTGFQLKEAILDSVDSTVGAAAINLAGGRSAFENTVGNSQSNKSAPTFQPDYTPVYDYSSRNLASSQPAAGCGRVKEVYKNKFHRDGRSFEPLMKKIFVVLIMLIPLLTIIILRLRNQNRIQRRFNRVKVKFAGDLFFEGMNVPVSIEDISEGGAGVSLKSKTFDKFLTNTQTVLLKVYSKNQATAQYPCTIVRNFEGKIGLKF